MDNDNKNNDIPTWGKVLVIVLGVIAVIGFFTSGISSALWGLFFAREVPLLTFLVFVIVMILLIKGIMGE
jgi:hypothetical protein